MAVDKLIKDAVLVGIQLPSVSSPELEASLQELSRLVKTLGYNVVGRVTQKRSSDKSPSVLGAGKLHELAEWTGGAGEIASSVELKLNKATLRRLAEDEAEDESENQDDQIDDADEIETPSASLSADQKNSAQIVIVDTDLSPSQIRNLESASGVTVLDRTGVIIEIFSRHAHTRAARLQVEIARLTYLAPRLRETGGSADRQGGGVGGKGAGESKLELDKRKVRDRIKDLRLELESLGNEHEVRRARRSQEACVALVGYTNAGKSSLMRAMTGSEVLVADKLFATLDTTIRPLHPETRPKVLVSDTVGFIKKLPHDLVASFKSTLDEALNASLLLFVVDSSDPSFRSQLQVTQSVLAEVGANEIPNLIILNKRDCLTAPQELELQNEYPEALMISALNKDDLKILREKIMLYFEKDMQDGDIFVPYSAKGIVGEIRAKMRVLDETYNEKGVSFRVRASSDLFEQMNKKISAN
jgi:GTP-binding protein HflX